MNIIPRAHQQLQPEHFRFLDLPIELRLKIYGYLLPPRTHTIITQIPCDGYYYNTTTVPAHAAQSFYPFGRSPPSDGKPATYKILPPNFRSPACTPSIYPGILRTCKKIYYESEPALYGNKETVFDFGTHAEALIAFMADRSKTARACVKNVRIATEIPSIGLDEDWQGTVTKGVSDKWLRLCDYLKSELTGLKDLDLTVWATDGSTPWNATLAQLGFQKPAEEDETSKMLRKEAEARWREWEWTKVLLEVEALRHTKITWWGSRSNIGEQGETIAFDSWLAGRMAGDRLVRDRMVKEGVVVEGSVVVPGLVAELLIRVELFSGVTGDGDTNDATHHQDPPVHPQISLSNHNQSEDDEVTTAPILLLVDRANFAAIYNSLPQYTHPSSSMTTVERYRPPHLFTSDAPSNAGRSHPPSTTLARTNVPPAVPSPPRLSRDSPPTKPLLEAVITPSPNFKMASDDSSQWIFTDAEIASAPSIVHGMTPEMERCLRAKGSNFILQAAILLKLPQLTIATASVFFHRFFMRASFEQSKGGFHHYTIAGTALFLASKTEETCRKTKEIVIACAKVAQKNTNLMIDEQSKEYWRWRDNLLLYEELMLEYLTFDLVLQSPHNLLHEFLRKLHIDDNKRIRNTAWAFLNDSCHTTICLSMPAKDIAIASIYFGAQFVGDTIPDDEHGNPWWEGLGGRPNKIVKGVQILSEFWTENPLRKSEIPYEQSPSSLSNEEDLHRSRRRADVGSSEDTPSPGRKSQLAQGMSRQQSQAESNGTAANTTADNSQVAKTKGPTNTSDVLNGKPTSPKPNVDVSKEHGLAVREAEEDTGGSDAALKEAANDPATHTATEPSSQNQKRKDFEAPEDPAAKRSKPSPVGGEVPDNAEAKIAGEENEEGELEE
ncbi:uncharacterized protein BP5553_02162 [Venustampulla echinocandica]|uniref:RNA polymerase II holoenzyme cyclin-like subunit n=1 Tax=Venustampulla echinocandica TaxID=2656787 RepID=A0A370U366_9HELO|nr:uncharacterized protein BP5553_02162 [Venustampulla echinocandica]RDL42183.1 hypothetical protein BP5553_02162 [Venustampulla echinocandica]